MSPNIPYEQQLLDFCEGSPYLGSLTQSAFFSPQLDLSATINLVYTPNGTMVTHPTLIQQSGTMYPNTTSFFPFAFYIKDPEAKYHLKIIPHTLIHVVSDYEQFCGSADKYPLKTKP